MFFFVYPSCKDRVLGKDRQRGGDALEMGLLNFGFHKKKKWGLESSD